MVRKSLISIVAIIMDRILPVLVVISLISGFIPEPALAISTVDGFNPGANSHLYTMAIQSDGRIIVAGAFEELAGHTHYRIGRLNPDGSLDGTFDTYRMARSMLSWFNRMTRSWWGACSRPWKPCGRLALGV